MTNDAFYDMNKFRFLYNEKIRIGELGQNLNLIFVLNFSR